MPNPAKPIKKRVSRVNKKGTDNSADIIGKAAAKKKERNITLIAAAAVVVVIALVSYYLFALLPTQRVLLSIGSENFTYQYFIKRVAVSSSPDVSSTYQLLLTESIVSQQGPAEGLKPVTDADVDTYLRDAAKGTGDTISNEDFETWLEQSIKNSGLSKSEYMEIAKRDVERKQLTDILTTDIKKEALQVHVWAMFFSTMDAANQASNRLAAGESFSAVVASANNSSTGGDYGWMPYGLLDSQLETTLESLEPGVYSNPLIYYQLDSSTGSYSASYVIMMISEKTPSMALTDSQYTSLQSTEMSDWLNTQTAKYKVTIKGLHGATSLDTATTTYINTKAQELIKERAAKATTTSTTTTSSTTTTTKSTTSTTSTP